MAERDMAEAGRAWMRGELSSADYFAMARRSVRPERELAPGWWRRLWRWLDIALRCLALPPADRKGKRHG